MVSGSELFLVGSMVSVVWVLVCDDGGSWVLVCGDGGLWVKVFCRWWVHGGAEYFRKFGFEWWFVMGVHDDWFDRMWICWMLSLICGKLGLLWVSSGRRYNGGLTVWVSHYFGFG